MKVFIEQIGDSKDPYMVFEWFCSEGDFVAQDQTLCTLEVGKAQEDVVSPVSGVVETIAVQVEQECLPGDLLCEIK